MLSITIILALFLVSSSCVCQIRNLTNLGQDYDPFLNAFPISLSQEPTITALYSNLTNISDYKVAINSNSSIYLNNYPLCVKSVANHTFNALYDVWLCLDDYYLLHCNQEWSLLIECGTFLQIHKPFDPKVQMRFNVQNLFWVKGSNGLNVTNILLNELCAGSYHIWFVYYSRQGKFIKRVKYIYLSYPSCNC